MQECIFVVLITSLRQNRINVQTQDLSVYRADIGEELDKDFRLVVVFNAAVVLADIPVALEQQAVGKRHERNARVFLRYRIDTAPKSNKVCACQRAGAEGGFDSNRINNRKDGMSSKMEIRKPRTSYKEVWLLVVFTTIHTDDE